MPDWLATLHYQRPIDHTRTAFQVAHNTNNLVFEWAMAHPDKFHDFNLWMAVQRDGMASWLDAFPVERFTQDSNDPRNALLVDIGGGIGHQCAALSAHLPDLGRSIVLQDIGPAIAQAIKAPGVEAMVADFWVEQPVKNASFYYLRNVLHDYEDKKCVELLQIQRRAMSKESVFLIDEIIMPDTKAQFAPSAQDIALMASLAAIERNKDQWKRLFDAAGLVLRETFTYSRELGYSVMVISAA
nr:demethylsterigmatocystin 6-o-methyltransferase [Quercus suber]